MPLRHKPSITSRCPPEHTGQLKGLKLPPKNLQIGGHEAFARCIEAIVPISPFVDQACEESESLQGRLFFQRQNLLGKHRDLLDFYLLHSMSLN